MTQYGLSLGQLIQSGIARGAGLYQSGQAMAMQREEMARQAQMDALRRQAMQQDIDQRAQAAREYVAQQEADREFMDLYAKTYLAEPVVQAPAPRTGMGPADDSALGVVQPAPPPAMPDWKQLSRASPRVQNLFLEAGENARLTREREKKDREEFAKMVGSDMSAFMGPREDTPEGWTGLANQYRRAMERGDVTSADVRKHAPPKVLAILDADEEGHRARLVDYLTTNAGPDGATVRDEAGAILLSGYPTRQLEAMTSSRRNEERKMAAEVQNAEAEIQRETAAMLAVSPTITPERARAYVMARRAGLVNQEAVNISGRPSLSSGERAQIGYERDRLEAVVKRAELEYRSVNPGENADDRMQPPTKEEIERAGQPQDPDGLWNKLSDKDYAALQRRVLAWGKLQEARSEYESFLKRAATPAASTVPAQPGQAQIIPASEATTPQPPMPAIDTDEQAVINEFRRQHGRTPNQNDVEALYQIEQSLRGIR